MVNLATNFSTKGPVWRPQFCARFHVRTNGTVWRPENERQVSENEIQNFENLSRLIRVTLTWHTLTRPPAPSCVSCVSKRRKVSHTLPAQREQRKKSRGRRDPCLHRKDTHNLFWEVCREFSALAMLGKRFLQLAWLHVIQAGVYREALKSAAHHACQQASAARQVLEHVICEDMQLAWRSGREADTVDSEESQARMKKTMTSEIVQI